jgi:hypothetical protein
MDEYDCDKINVIYIFLDSILECDVADDMSKPVYYLI